MVEITSSPGFNNLIIASIAPSPLPKHNPYLPFSSAAKLFSKNHQLFESTNLKRINVINLQKAVVRENKITGYVQYIDKFGNLVTNIPFDKAKLMSKVFIGNKEIGKVRSHYSELNASGGIFGSHGFVEIASIEKSAQHLHKASIGSPVKLITSV